jgi:hypothetical protein
MQVVDMEVQHIEFACLTSNDFEHTYMVRQRVKDLPALKSQGFLAYGPQVGYGYRVGTREESHIMPLADQLIRQI